MWYVLFRLMNWPCLNKIKKNKIKIKKYIFFLESYVILIRCPLLRALMYCSLFNSRSIPFQSTKLNNIKTFRGIFQRERGPVLRTFWAWNPIQSTSRIFVQNIWTVANVSQTRLNTSTFVAFFFLFCNKHLSIHWFLNLFVLLWKSDKCTIQ